VCVCVCVCVCKYARYLFCVFSSIANGLSQPQQQCPRWLLVFLLVANGISTMWHSFISSGSYPDEHHVICLGWKTKQKRKNTSQVACVMYWQYETRHQALVWYCFTTNIIRVNCWFSSFLQLEGNDFVFDMESERWRHVYLQLSLLFASPL